MVKKNSRILIYLCLLINTSTYTKVDCNRCTSKPFHYQPLIKKTAPPQQRAPIQPTPKRSLPQRISPEMWGRSILQPEYKRRIIPSTISAKNKPRTIQTSAPIIPALTQPQKKQPTHNEADLQKLLAELEAGSIQEALNNLQDMEKVVSNKIESIYQTIAKATNSDSIKKKLATITTQAQNNKERVIDFAAHMTELNQLTYDAIFNLKARYFETTQWLKEFAEPVIQQLRLAVEAKQQGKPAEEIMEMISAPVLTPPSPQNKEEMIIRVNELAID